jgi:hypothetical protein
VRGTLVCLSAAHLASSSAAAELVALRVCSQPCLASHLFVAFCHTLSLDGQVPYNCLDWANRHAVAKAVRNFATKFSL